MLIEKRGTLVDTNNHANLEVTGVVSLTEDGFARKFVGDDGNDYTDLLKRTYGAASVYVDPDTSE